MRIIQADGVLLDQELTDTSLEAMQKLVGGYIEFVYFDDGSAVMVHEEGKLIGLPLNKSATILLIEKSGSTLDWLAGTAVFFTVEEMKRMREEDA